MRERVAIIGEATPLVGIITSQTSERTDPRLPAVVVLNAGLLPRVGPHRLSVRISRRLAAIGCTTLRFDLGGLGDSARREPDLPYPEGPLQDITRALDYLQQAVGIRHFVLVGLCSGADNALRAAVRDERIVGAIIIDGFSYTYKTSVFYLHHYGKRAFRLRSWRTMIRKGLSKLLAGFRQLNPHGDILAREPTPFSGWIPPKPPPRVEVARQLRALMKREVGLYAIYTGSLDRYYNYPGQFVDVFCKVNFNDCLETSFLPDVNHTFTELRAQDWLLDAVESWMRRRFLSGALSGSEQNDR